MSITYRVMIIDDNEAAREVVRDRLDVVEDDKGVCVLSRSCLQVLRTLAPL